MSVVWECGSCGARSLERRCEECNLFCSRVGVGGECPACAELVAAAELDAAGGPEHPVLSVEVIDAVELAEILDYIGEWLTDAAPAVTASLIDYGGGPDAPHILLEALARHSRALLGGDLS
jgi:hypothetical protein